ncbi:hypothetical protein [endosymbiont GvMRE of Glomus versiforme]|uniref:hypothetical protein n=1 Tax=endosymbiont GvMRE of Glomus versiforme TaxID=2039283 RepID=UPI000EC5E027|nr:hypothetical protein [endosymbiont GvMRE of Glomus versiforme]RHZ36339.1 hypothetical protein GvMRE_Ic1g200 [endosymbiont GvMRE of Glomus versiforme]
MSENKECSECQVDFPVNQKFKYYWLVKNQGGAVRSKEICSNCWNKNQETYKQLKEGHDTIKEVETYIGSRDGMTTGNDQLIMRNIWTACKEETCDKKFDPFSVEALRHNPACVSMQNISFDTHEELNKNPALVNTLEELIQQWMESMEYQRIYYKNDEIGIVTKDGEVKGVSYVDMGGTQRNFWNELTRLLKTKKPNYEIIRINSSNQPNTRRERANQNPVLNWNKFGNSFKTII